MGFTYKSDLTQSSDASPDKSLVQNSNGSVPRDTNAGETVSNKKKWIKRCVAVLKLLSGPVSSVPAGQIRQTLRRGFRLPLEPAIPSIARAL